MVELRIRVNGTARTLDVSPHATLLQVLRNDLGLTGTKEGCREGDCGACAVLIGTPDGNHVAYRPVTSCLVPLGELHGKHLVTIEGLNLERLTPVQQAITDTGATQCGFCTPGIVVSLTGCLMSDAAPATRESLREALGGHLCRCTGYRSLKDSTARIVEAVGSGRGVATLVSAGILPDYFREMPERLRAIRDDHVPVKLPEEGFVVAGGTDVYVQQGDQIPGAAVEVLNRHPEMMGIERQNGTLRVGALTTFEAFAGDPEVRRVIPDIKSYMFLIASLQIRHRATLGGNVINASPIGDMTILLLALDATLVLRRGAESRTVPLASFYRGYKEMDRRPDEVLSEILIPASQEGTRINWEKVSKRKCLDIASVNSAARVRTEDDVIADAAVTMGGVAPIPLLLRQTSQFLIGKPVDVGTVKGAMRVMQLELTPISDIRGSASYKRLLARQFMITHFCRMYPERVSAEEFYEAH